jgi:hypothetical protein
VLTKRGLALLTALLALVVLPGCWTTSLQALYAEGDQHLIYDPALVGKWQGEHDSPVSITGDSTTGNYTLDASDEDGRYVYNAGLVQLGSYRFLDVVPIASYDSQGNSQEAALGYIRSHSILKVSMESDSLFLMAPDDSKLCVAARKKKPPMGDCIDGDFVFTARTAALQEYFLQHATDPNLFDKQDPDWALHRVVAKQGGGQ